MGPEELVEGTDFIFEYGMVIILIPVTDDIHITATAAEGDGPPLPTFTISVTGDHITSAYPGTVTYGDLNVSITFTAEEGYYVHAVITVLMGSAELTEGIDYIFEDGAMIILIPITGNISITAYAAETPSERLVHDMWILPVAASLFFLTLLLAFLIARRVRITGIITDNGKNAAGVKIDYIERIDEQDRHGSVISNGDGRYTVYTKIGATVTITSISENGVSLSVKPPAPITVKETVTEVNIG